MTEQHECDYGLRVVLNPPHPHIEIACACGKILSVWEARRRLNEYETLKRLDVEMMTTDAEGNPVGCGMDLLDWQAHLQTELGLVRLENRTLKRATEALQEAARNYIETYDVTICKKEDGDRIRYLRWYDQKKLKELAYADILEGNDENERR